MTRVHSFTVVDRRVASPSPSRRMRRELVARVIDNVPCPGLQPAALPIARIVTL